MSVNSGSHNVPAGVNPGIGYVDLMMNQMLMEQMKSINSTGGFTIGTVVSLLLILSLSELKPVVSEFMKSSIENIKNILINFPEKIKSFFCYVGNLLFGFIIKKYKNYKSNKKKDTCNEKNTQNQLIITTITLSIGHQKFN